MKYQWVKQPMTKERVEALLGVKVKQFTIGELSSAEEDISESGIEIELETELTPSQLEKLDLLFPGLNRHKE